MFSTAVAAKNKSFLGISFNFQQILLMIVAKNITIVQHIIQTWIWSYVFWLSGLTCIDQHILKYAPHFQNEKETINLERYFLINLPYDPWMCPLWKTCCDSCSSDPWKSPDQQHRGNWDFPCNSDHFCGNPSLPVQSPAPCCFQNCSKQELQNPWGTKVV